MSRVVIKAKSLPELSNLVSSWISQGGVIEHINIMEDKSKYYMYEVILNEGEALMPRSLKEARVMSGVTLYDAGLILDLGASNVRDYEITGRFTETHLIKLARAYGLTYGYAARLNRKERRKYE